MNSLQGPPENWENDLFNFKGNLSFWWAELPVEGKIVALAKARSIKAHEWADWHLAHTPPLYAGKREGLFPERINLLASNQVEWFHTYPPAEVLMSALAQEKDPARLWMLLWYRMSDQRETDAERSKVVMQTMTDILKNSFSQQLFQTQDPLLRKELGECLVSGMERLRFASPTWDFLQAGISTTLRLMSMTNEAGNNSSMKAAYLFFILLKEVVKRQDFMSPEQWEMVQLLKPSAHSGDLDKFDPYKGDFSRWSKPMEDRRVIASHLTDTRPASASKPKVM